MSKESDDEFKGESSCKDVHDVLTVRGRFHCDPATLFSAFTDARDVMRYTQAPASFDAKAGGDFSFFEGQVLGRFTEVDAPKSFVCKWKFKEWAVGDFSTVEVTIEEKGSGLCEVTVKQSGIPKADAYGRAGTRERCEGGWKERILGGMKKFLGYGYEPMD